MPETLMTGLGSMMRDAADVDRRYTELYGIVHDVISHWREHGPEGFDEKMQALAKVVGR